MNLTKILKKFHENVFMLIFSIVLLCTICAIVSTIILGPSNNIEIIAEDVIECETGIKINFDFIKGK